ncbi:MAG: PqqD family protein [Elusimicrobiota bacterium]
MKNRARLDCVYRHNPDTASRRIDCEVVILDLKTSVYYSLNETASTIWETLGEGLTPRRAVERLCGEFDKKPADVARDVTEIVEELLRARLIHRVD